MQKWSWPAAILFIALSACANYLHWGQTVLFLLSGFAIIPLAAIIGRATESVAAHAGSRIGGLLSATFGNAVELIIGIMALQQGLITLVKASITGSILGNLLLVLGLSFFTGGLRHPVQRFNVRAARSNASMLMLGVGVAFVLPAVFTFGGDKSPPRLLFAVAAGVSLLLYLAGLLFSLFTHSEFFDSIEALSQKEEQENVWRLWPAVLVLLCTTVLVAVESDWLVKSVEYAGRQLGWSELFMGIVVVAIVGNAAEHASAVLMAWKNRMDLSMEIAVGSSLQVAMFVAPVLFFVSLLLGHAMPLDFSWPELGSLTGAIVLVTVLMMDGESNWLEGALAMGAYLVIAVGFFTL